MNISVRAGIQPLIDAWDAAFPSSKIAVGPNKTYFIATLSALPLINQAIAAASPPGKFIVTVRVLLKAIASIPPASVVDAHRPPAPPPPSSAPGGGKKPPPPPKPIIAAEVVAGGSDLFSPMRIYGQGFNASEGVQLIQILDGSQAPLFAAMADGSGRFDITLSLLTHTHYNVYAHGSSSNLDSNEIGFTTL